MAEGDADLLFLLAASLVIAVVVAGCMKSSDEAGAQAGAGRGAGGGARGALAQGGGNAGAKAAQPKAPARPLSARARALQRELGLPLGAAVTFTTHHILFDDTRHPHARWAPKPEALAVLRLLLEFADVFLLNEVKEREEDEAALKAGLLAGLRAAGVVRASKGGSGFGVEEHKILYYSTAVGRQAVARQLRPQLHVDYAREVCGYLVPHVPHLLFVHPSAAGERPDAAPYRVLASLGALLELLPPSEEPRAGDGAAAGSGIVAR